MIERILALEAESRRLDPDKAAREQARSEVVEYAERFLASLPEAKAYQADKSSALELRNTPIRDQPTELSQLLQLFDNAVIEPGINTASAGHLGHIPGGGVHTAALGDYLAAVTNRFVGVRYASPGAVEMEEATLAWMADLVGLGDGWGGSLTPGGTVANFIGIVTARQAHGLRARDFERVVVYETAHAHHCVEKALGIAGMAECVRRRVPMDERYRMDPQALEDAIEQDEQAGLRPWLLVGSAGTTNVGAIDPLADLGVIARKKGLWYHVDAAYGGFFALLPEVAPQLSGMSLADSIVLDPHKSLFLPFGSGAILVRDKAALYGAHAYTADYMQDTLSEHTLELASPADLSLEFSKHFRGPRLWLPLLLHGVSAFRACLEEKLLLARYFHQEVRKLGFEVGPEPELSVSTYRWLPSRGDADAFNERLISEIHKDGTTFVTSTLLDGIFVLRVAVLSFRTRLAHVQRYLAFLEETVARLESEIA